VADYEGARRGKEEKRGLADGAAEEVLVAGKRIKQISTRRVDGVARRCKSTKKDSGKEEIDTETGHHDKTRKQNSAPRGPGIYLAREKKVEGPARPTTENGLLFGCHGYRR